jgi:hypothetical protein
MKRFVPAVLSAALVLHCVGDDPVPGAATDPDGGNAADAPSVPPDAPAGDAGGEGFCATKRGSFCEDFDHGSLVENGWASTLTNRGTVQLAQSDRSAPFALQSTTPASKAEDGDTAAFVSRVLPVPAGYTHLRVAVDVRVTQRDDVLQPKTMIGLYIGGGKALYVLSNGKTQIYGAAREADAGAPVFLESPFNTWIHIEFCFEKTGTTLDASIYVDDRPMLAHAASYPISTEESWKIELGARNISTNGTCSFYYDNVLVTGD